MSALKPFPEYKDSSAPWLGDVPADWGVVRAKSVLKERKTKSGPTDVHLTPSQTYGVLPQAEYMERTGNKVVLNLTGADDMRHVEPNDFISHLRSFQGGLEYSPLRGKVSAAYTVLEPLSGVAPAYFRYLFKSSRYIQALQTTTDQLRDGQSIRFAQLGLLPLPLPELDIQHKVASFLDRETAEIDAFIADQEELIGLLAERRAATISHAVSDEARAERLPLRRLVAYLGQGWSPVCEIVPASEGQWGVLKVGCVNGGTFVPSENKALPTELEPRTQFTVRNGDILVSRGNTQELVGSAALVESDYPRLLVSDLLYQMRVNTRRVSERFLVLALSSRAVRGQIESIAKGTSASMQKISQGDLLDLKIWLPPLAVQHEIEVRVLSETLELDAAIGDARAAIVLSLERRAALISAAVTGKIDVRERGVA